MKIWFENTSPREKDEIRRKFEEYPGEDIFSASLTMFKGDVHIENHGSEIVFENVRVVNFSVLLMYSSVVLSFIKETTRRIEYEHPGAVRLSLSIESSDFVMDVQLGTGATIRRDGLPVVPGNGFEARFPLQLWNLAIGEYYESIIHFVEGNLNGIDGVREFFCHIPFFEVFGVTDQLQ